MTTSSLKPTELLSENLSGIVVMPRVDAAIGM